MALVDPQRDAAVKAYQDALAEWQKRATIESHGGPAAGPKPAYQGPPANLIEPNSANGAGDDSALSGYNLSDPNNIGKPQDQDIPQQNTTAHQDGGDSGGPPPAPPTPPATPNLSTGERVNYDYNDPNGATDRNQQQEYINQLKARAAGQGPSVAAEQYKQALGNINRNSLGMAAQARGGDAVAARRAAIMGGAQQTAQAAQGAALLRATEQTQAQDLLGGQIGAMRTTDTGLAQHIADQTSNLGTNNLNRESTERIQGGAQGLQKYGYDTQKYGYDIQAAYEKYKADQLRKAAEFQAGATAAGGIIDIATKYAPVAAAAA